MGYGEYVAGHSDFLNARKSDSIHSTVSEVKVLSHCGSFFFLGGTADCPLAGLPHTTFHIPSDTNNKFTLTDH